MNLNQDLIRSRCQEISDSLQRVEEIGKQPKAEFLRNQDLQDIACYRLLVAMEAALAICYHIAAKKFRKVPEEYAECFEILGERGIIPQELCLRLQQMTRFRNLLVHMYFKVDYERVYEIMHSSTSDLRAFCREVVGLL